MVIEECLFADDNNSIKITFGSLKIWIFPGSCFRDAG
jgi:hypothetical protein